MTCRRAGNGGKKYPQRGRCVSLRIFHVRGRFQNAAMGIPPSGSRAGRCRSSFANSGAPGRGFGPGGGRGTCAWSREIAPEQLGGDLLRLITHGYADITRIRFPVVVFHRRVAFAQVGVFLFLQRLLDNRLFGEVCHLALQEYVDEVGILVGRRDPEVYRGGRQIRGLDRLSEGSTGAGEPVVNSACTRSDMT